MDIVATQSDGWGYPQADQNRPWYRGHSSVGWRLLPSGLRGRKWNTDTCDNENECLEEFLTKAPALGLPASSSLSLWDGYFLMQHHCVPTRLLDWTESVLVAAYFAVSETPSDSDAAIWMLDPYELNERNPGFSANSVVSPGFVGNLSKEKDKINRWLPLSCGEKFDCVPPLPLALYPAYFSRRIENQRAAFTIHGSDTEGLAKSWRRGGQLLRIVIPGKSAKKFRTVLRDLGVNTATVYPDMQGLGRHLAERWGPTKESVPHGGVYVRLRPSKIHKGGVGVFAIRPIKKGKNIFAGEDEKMFWTDEGKLPKERNLRKLYTDFGVKTEGRYGTPQSFNAIGPGWYLNHSSRPNVKSNESFDFLAARDIRQGEELSVDYSTYSD